MHSHSVFTACMCVKRSQLTISGLICDYMMKKEKQVSFSALINISKRERSVVCTIADHV